MGYLKIGSNSKLGKGIASWNIPAVSTCPGRTQSCESVCYANKGLFKLQSRRYAEHYNLAESDTFVDIINAELATGKIKAVRIHAAGDFYSSDYIRKWIDIIRANPSVKFWSYTRSWRTPLRLPLKKLAALPNLQLFASIDNESRGEKIPTWLRRADLLEDFEKRPDYVQCPNQKNKKITCEKCTYCFKDAPTIKTNIMFKVH